MKLTINKNGTISEIEDEKVEYDDIPFNYINEVIDQSLIDECERLSILD